MKRQVWVTTLTVIFVSVCSFVLMTSVVSAPGDLDTSFNGTGSALLGFGQGDDAGNAVAAQADGKVVVVGTSKGSLTYIEVMRYNVDGSLDVTFGNTGTGKIRLLGAGFGGIAHAVRIQSDGKIVIAGTAFDGSLFNINLDFELIRLNADGSLDPTFGDHGAVSTAIGSEKDEALGLAIQADGRIVAVGYSTSGSFFSSATVRYNADGTLDNSFNGNGKTTLRLGALDFATAVTILADGKILVAGGSGDGTKGDFMMLRYATNGVIDNSFGNSGVVQTDFGGSDDQAAAMAIQPGTISLPDTIVVAGSSRNIVTNNSAFAVARYSLAGALDSSFGTAGRVITSISSHDQGQGVIVQSGVASRKIVIAGRSVVGSQQFALVRLNGDGSIDTSFDGDGKTTTSIELGAQANGLTSAAGGKVVVAGTAFNSTEGDFAIARYNSDGSLDSSFDGDGQRFDDTDLPAAGAAVAIQPDQKIVVAGACELDLTYVFAVARYNSDGSLDTSFDGDGRAITGFGGGDDVASSVAIQPDGKIVAAGGSSAGGHEHFAAVRYNPDGSLDSGFGTAGKVTTAVATDDAANGVAIQPDGKIILGGTARTPTTAAFALLRYNSNGTPDATFGSGGKVTTLVGLNDSGVAVAIQPDGKILLGGQMFTGGALQFAVLRYNSNGSLDTSFAGAGIAGIQIGPDGSFANAMVLQADGRIVVDGQVGTVGGGLAMARFNADGSIDTSFDGDGIVLMDGVSSLVVANGVAVQSDGRIIASGFRNNNISSGDFAAMRLNANGSVDTTYGSNGRVTVDVGHLEGDGANGISLDASGRAVLVGSAGNGNSLFAMVRLLGGGTGPTPTPTPTATPTPTPTPTPNVAQFSSSNYTVQEDCTTVTINVQRIGDASAAASVDYQTSDVTATERKDYIKALGTLRFAAGETSKSFAVLINEDSFVEGDETFNITLSNPSGINLGGPAITTVTITDDAGETAANPIDDPRNYVCQHYHDFLNRQPDQSGWDFWTRQITDCGNDAACIEVRRINVSASFFLSIEFQDTGYLVERIYKAAFGDATGNSTFPAAHQLPVPVVRLNEFLADTQEIGQGVIVGQGNWQQQIENNKQAFTTAFVQRSRFLTAFPAAMTAAQFVDTLNANAGNPLSAGERNQLVNDLATNAKTRAQVLRAVAESQTLKDAEFNRAFVLMQYFGYLRRNPNDPQDSDHTGYDFWLTKQNQFNGNYINAEMVKAFITSIEYRQRFGP